MKKGILLQILQILKDNRGYKNKFFDNLHETDKSFQKHKLSKLI